ncbi:signal transduction histidine kinase [Kibdelosporangium banguiense]|uniref:histidine kinase n=1 Tax=Kibdelosporangium banguiense TaxID=1365924 RepID=A0ABS4TWS4_9PSEU|nr:ATP-binding protein [Kibdelosporangium banguiense]MBP2328859.1 signal transduction histidine kinase [Kibdelosporangium banguiense]
MPTSLVIVVGLPAVLILLVLLVRQRHVSTRLRGHLIAARQAVEQRDGELEHLGRARIPAVVESVGGKQGEVPPPLYPQLESTRFGQLLNGLMDMATNYESTALRRADEQARSAILATARRVQSLAAHQQAAISDMQHKHDDPEVLEGLLVIDHANAQLSRRAQTLAVLGDSWPGTQRSMAADIVDVVRGATSRIRDYQRVEVTSRAAAAVKGSCVEPVVLAVAELLDNAASFSEASVRVDVQQASNGIAIVIDDAGIGMTPDQVTRATSLLTRGASVKISELGNPAQIGLPVCGALAKQYRFKVSVDTSSPYGGVRAVVFVPNEMLVSHTTTEDHHGRRPVPAVPPPTQAAAPAVDAAVVERTPNGLPIRRRREPSALVAPAAASRSLYPQPAAHRSVQASADNIAGWQDAAAANRGHATWSDDERIVES